MPSPFPGMDPYLEAPKHWLEFHSHLAAEIAAALNRVLDPRYRARLASYTAYEMEVPVKLFRVEIVTTDTEQLITAIEILSPSNKRRGHEDQEKYLRKRRDLLWSSAHVMEIDLLRGGERPPLEQPVPIAPFYVVVSRVERRPEADVWPIQLAERLPVLPAPLVAPDPEVPLDLGITVASAYERAAFERAIDYDQPPPPPALTTEESAWLETLLRAKGIRAESRDGAC